MIKLLSNSAAFVLSYVTSFRSFRFFALTTLIGGQLMTACVSTRQLSYFQNAPGTRDTMRLTARYEPVVQAGDVLSVQVSSLNPDATTFFNPYANFAVAERIPQTTSNSTTPLPPVTGYLVDNAGNIELPVLGKVAVAGQTTVQVRDRLRDRLREYLKDPTVNIRNQNFRISVMGEVARPSLFTIPNEQINLLEALSLAGDVTIYGKRENVLVIREENGVRTFTRLDLTRRDLFNSPYYHLHPNDVVYVEPGRARAALADRTNQVLPLALSGLSFLAIIFSRF